MQTITSPQQPKYTSLGENHGKFEILGCHPGYGTTLGNALRRVILSSLDGAAARSVKITGVSHEFSTIDGVMEDVVQIILNLKQVRFRLHGDEPVKITLKSKGEGVVTAAAFKTTSNIEVVNPDQVIFTISEKKTEVEMEIEVDKGLGYVPVEHREKSDDHEIGVIAIDAIYTPVKRVNYEVENMRVGKRTDYDKITLEIVTDGTVSPVVAFEKSVAILVGQFSALGAMESDAVLATEVEVTEAVAVEAPVEEVKEKKKVVRKKKTEAQAETE